MRSRSLLSVFFLVMLAVEAESQVRPTNWQVQAIGTTAAEEFAGVGLGWAHRTPGRLRFGVTATAGSLGGLFGIRAEATTVFVLDASRAESLGLYGGGGIAWQQAVQGTDRGFIVLLLGVEASPRGPAGWFAELGVGGGLRASIGWRLRR